MRNYGIPEKIFNLTRKMYGRTVSKVIHEGQLSESFEMKTGVSEKRKESNNENLSEFYKV